MPIPLIVAVIAAVVAVALTILLIPKPKISKPEATTDLENPVAEAGKPVPVPFGTVTIKGLNVLHFSDKSFLLKKVK